MKKIFKHIKQLIQIRPKELAFVKGQEMGSLPLIENAYMVVEDGRISSFGRMENLNAGSYTQTIDCTDRIIWPTWCDSHTHIVYAGDRSGEFVDRINGLSYQEIANKGGGILHSALKLGETSEDELYDQSVSRLKEVMAMGTGAIEIKSGYGLTPSSELKMLRVIRRLKENFLLPVRSTYLGAHAVPAIYQGRREEYVQEVAELLPVIAKDKLADYIDVFCEEGYFSVDEMVHLIKQAKAYGLKAKVHVNQFNSIGGVAAAVAEDALSVDHLERLKSDDMIALKDNSTMPVALPGCSYFLSIPYTPARKMIDKGLPLALASDFNPGSCPSGNMNFVVATACVKMKMTPEEAINAATINGAFAMGLESEVGSITVGKRANFILSKPIDSYYNIPYSFGSDVISAVYISGNKLA